MVSEREEKAFKATALTWIYSRTAVQGWSYVLLRDELSILRLKVQKCGG
jgi:hypothetical protein